MKHRELVNEFLCMKNGRAKAREHGLEKEFDEELGKIRERLPHITFVEMTVLGFDEIAKQRPVTLEEMLEQFIRVKIRSIRTKDVEAETKHLLRTYYPDWDEREIDVEFKRLWDKSKKEAINKTVEGILPNRAPDGPKPVASGHTDIKNGK